MTGPVYYDREGRQITMALWTTLYRDEVYVRVAEDEVGDLRVSTVWFGLDHAFPGGDVPLIFETMVFGSDGVENQERYSTEADARAGHRRWVKWASTIEIPRQPDPPDPPVPPLVGGWIVDELETTHGYARWEAEFDLSRDRGPASGEPWVVGFAPDLDVRLDLPVTDPDSDRE